MIPSWQVKLIVGAALVVMALAIWQGPWAQALLSGKCNQVPSPCSRRGYDPHLDSGNSPHSSW